MRSVAVCPGGVRVRIEAFAVDGLDDPVRRGTAPLPARLPHARPGREGTGIIDAVGAGATAAACFTGTLVTVGRLDPRPAPARPARSRGTGARASGTRSARPSTGGSRWTTSSRPTAPRQRRSRPGEERRDRVGLRPAGDFSNPCSPRLHAVGPYPRG
ncbi:alcohol dehydrogenase catalytic domain-containing protein [Streptomyces sp. P6-2-1]|uniref:alcohol dehydrogenase catalytic domain-containing protein n=1 Tax=Streptomyces sp. P6-2-1 TaxID=3422591 RepID=UPI003D35E692